MPRKKKYIREEVIKKAMKVFWDNGYKGTSMRMLEKEMGINLYSIYADFGNKEGIFLETLARYRKLNKEVILKPLLTSNGDIEDIRIFFNGFIDSVKSGNTPNGCLFANTAMEIGSTDEKIIIELDVFFRMLKDAYNSLLIKSFENGQLIQIEKLDKYANFLVGATEGVAVIAKVLNRKKLDDFIETTLGALQ